MASTTKVEAGIFAHNEEKDIALLLGDIYRQTIFSNKNCRIRFSILANNCSDNTVNICKAAIAALPEHIQHCFQVFDLKDGGKSRTWNYFVHTVLDVDTEAVFFMDADIRIDNNALLGGMVDELSSRTELNVLTSRPVKSVSDKQAKTGFVQKLIASAGGTSTNYKKSICGQLYLTKKNVLDPIYMPVGLPVEDGFIRAMLLTNLLVDDENLNCIDGDERFSHSYESINSVSELVSHQTRIVIGSAINSVVFDLLREENASVEYRSEMLKNGSQNEEWLEGIIRQRLPKLPYGFVPFQFLYKRIKNMFSENKKINPRKLIIAILGLIFDFVVYVNATLKMALGRGAGYW